MSEECLLLDFDHPRSMKSDGSDLDSSNFIKAMPVISGFHCNLTIMVRHGYLPEYLRDCTLISVLKVGKDFFSTECHQPIALALTFFK